MNIIERNVLDVIGPAVICHQVNCQGVMGGGLALQIRNTYPRAYNAYKAKKDWRLGDCQLCCVDTRRDINIWVANLAGQDDFGPDLVQTDYGSLAMALRTARDFADANGLALYLPYMIGCGLAGGDWATVTALIEEFTPDAVICKLPQPS